MEIIEAALREMGIPFIVRDGLICLNYIGDHLVVDYRIAYMGKGKYRFFYYAPGMEYKVDICLRKTAEELACFIKGE